MPDTSRPIYITTPIYYVNDRPHIGHAYTSIAADFLARANRVLGRPAYFLTGTDEHGAKIAEVAAAHGVTPQVWCDQHSSYFREVWKRLDIDFDRFIRTTDDIHVHGVSLMLERLHKAVGPDGQPVIYEGEYSGWYCLGCEKFITEKELVDGHCPLHPDPPRKITERNYFFRLSAFLPKVEELIASGTIQIKPDERRREVMGLFKQGLEDFSISREKVDWGIPLPFDPSQNAYVWVDALPNYITAIGYADDPSHFERWWTHGEVVHLMAKDILKFHAIYWPAMLLALGEALPEVLYIHGYFTVNGQKMSKSLRNVIDPNAIADQFGPDGTRHLLLTQFQFGQDGDVKAEEFIRQYNADLANDMGNLVSRAVTLIERHFEGHKPTIGPLEPVDEELQRDAAQATARFEDAVRRISPNEAISAGLELARAANRYMERTAPWVLAKSGQTERLGTVLGTTVEAIRIAAVILSADIPRKSREILRALGFADPDQELTSAGLHGWGRCPGPFHLAQGVFPRMEKPAAAPAPESASVATAPENVITIDQFFQAQLRVARVTAAETVPGANRLLKLQIEIGGEPRQIVAGIAEHYKPEELIGKSIVVVANLQPATIRGVTSNGMLLAASIGKTLRLVTPDGPIDSGAKVG
ncbi:MAG: methionine--tRNA ligase [candidate division Zixibacteria bacterium]|nr:methionine--tRNA ligase [candidate division Zixibacteria bacterium]